MTGSKTGLSVPKTDTRFENVRAYVHAVVTALKGSGLSDNAAVLYTAFAIKAQRGWKPNGRLWNFNLWGVKANPSWVNAGLPYFEARTSERDKKTGKYYDIVSRWRSFKNVRACTDDHLRRMRSNRYKAAHAVAVGTDLSRENVERFAQALYKGGYFTAEPTSWANGVFKNIDLVRSNLT